MVRTLFNILGRQRAVVRLFIIVLVLLILLFLAGERALITNVVTGTFPLWLFLSILPTLFVSFFTSSGHLLTMHYLLTTLLLGVYLLLVHHIFIKERYLSFKSMGAGLAGLLGISLGLSCLSCGALAGLLLISVFGASAASLAFLHTTSLFFLLGEALLVIAIALALAAIRRFE